MVELHHQFLRSTTATRVLTGKISTSATPPSSMIWPEGPTPLSTLPSSVGAAVAPTLPSAISTSAVFSLGPSPQLFASPTPGAVLVPPIQQQLPAGAAVGAPSLPPYPSAYWHPPHMTGRAPPGLFPPPAATSAPYPANIMSLPPFDRLRDGGSSSDDVDDSASPLEHGAPSDGGRARRRHDSRPTFRCIFPGCEKLIKGGLSKMRRHERVHSGHPWPCPVANCGQLLPNRAAFETHCRGHDGVGPRMVPVQPVPRSARGSIWPSVPLQ